MKTIETEYRLHELKLDCNKNAIEWERTFIEKSGDETSQSYYNKEEII